MFFSEQGPKALGHQMVSTAVSPTKATEINHQLAAKLFFFTKIKGLGIFRRFTEEHVHNPLSF